MLPCGRPCAPCQGIFVLQYTLDVLGLCWAQRSPIVTLTSQYFTIGLNTSPKTYTTWPKYFSQLFYATRLNTWPMKS